MKEHNYYIYILTTSNNKVMYVGITNNLQRRIYEHQNKLVDGFTKKYNLDKLVYYENTTNVDSAIMREKEIKKWRIEKKDKLVETINPNWNDLSANLFYEISQSTEKDSLLRNDKFSIGGLVIAAGFSSRMGKFKPLLRYNGKSFLQNIVTKLDSVCDEIVVVTGHNGNLIETELSLFQNKAKIITNENYKDGMFTSLQTGLKKTSNNNWVLYHFIDQPTLPNSFYKDFLEQINNEFDWIQPKYNRVNGHPILLNRKLANLILEAPHRSNLKEITHSPSIIKKHWDCNYPEIHDDIDTIERYNKLPK